MRFIIAISLLLFSTISCANFPYYPLQFPRDEAAHHENIPYSFQKMVEWWYYNGRAMSDDGKQLSFDVAIFNATSKWLGNNVTVPMLHIQVVDVDNKQAYGAKINYWPNTGNFSTKKLDIKVNNDYSLRKITMNGKTFYVLNASATENTTTLTLHLKLEPISEPFLINENGLMQMLDETNSYYYSIPKFKTTGTIKINDHEYKINNTPGDAWMDHQWGDFDVDKHGWEWFSVRLDNGLIANIFLFLNGKNNMAIGGLANVILPNGEKRFIPFSDMTVNRSRFWYDKDADVDYPMTFTIDIPSIGLSLQNDALFNEQELHGYWEGYCSVKGLYNNQESNGFSYTELVYD